MKEEIGKGSILTAGVGCVSAGIALAKEGQLEFGIGLVVAGLAFVVVFAYLLEKQVVKKVMSVVK